MHVNVARAVDIFLYVVFLVHVLYYRYSILYYLGVGPIMPMCSLSMYALDRGIGEAVLWRLGFSRDTFCGHCVCA